MSDEGRFNPTTYETVKTYLKDSLEHVIAAGHNVKEFSEFTLEKFGDTYIPHLRQFLSDVGHGEIEIKGLTKAAKTAIVGRHVTRGEREAMIRQEAYYQAERHGFTPGSEANDWIAAEKVVDARLAEEAGLVAKGRKALGSTATIAEKEFDNLKAVVTTWLEEKYGTFKKSVANKKASAPKAAETVSTPPKATAKKETTVKTVAQAKTVAQEQKPAAKQAVENKVPEKKAAEKKPAPKKAATKEPAKEASVKKKAAPKKATKK